MVRVAKTDQIQVRISPEEKKIVKSHIAMRGETFCEFAMRMVKIDKELMAQGK